jgi:hypothetical protein
MGHYVEDPETRERYWVPAPGSTNYRPQQLHPRAETALDAHERPLHLHNFIPQLDTETMLTGHGSSFHAGNPVPVGGPETTSGVPATSFPSNNYMPVPSAGTIYRGTAFSQQRQITPTESSPEQRPETHGNGIED